ncbi:MAG: alpha/beta fold hydrolase [Micrococcales bacterium]
METKLVTLSDGRQFEIQVAGSPQANAVVFHHGTPGGSSTWASWLEELARLGGFGFSYSRPGFGLSDRNAGRSVLDNASDIAEVLSLLGITKTVSIGWSGGGPHCLADTTLNQNVAAISIAGVGAFGASDLNFLEGMGEENHVEFGAAIEGSEAIEAWMQQYSPEIAAVTGDQIIEAFGGLIGEADKQALRDGSAEETAASFRQALQVSYYGWMDDDLAFVRHWGFEIGEINKPVELWQGNDDFMVPHAHGYWLESKIPTAKLNFVPGEGHISLGQNQREAILKNALGYLN